MTALNGQDIDLECEVGGDPNPTVLWHREDGTLPHGRTRIQGGKLSIQNVTPKDEGVYVCEAQNTVGTISVSATLSVHGKPFLWGAETYFTIFLLCLVVLPCFFSCMHLQHTALKVAYNMPSFSNKDCVLYFWRRMEKAKKLLYFFFQLTLTSWSNQKTNEWE